MQDIIATIAAEQIAEIVVTLVIAASGAAGTIALAQLSRWLGEKRTAALRDMLTPAIERGIAQARERGLTEDALRDWTANYVKQTMGGTLSKLKASDGDLRKRVAAQAAIEVVGGLFKHR